VSHGSAQADAPAPPAPAPPPPPPRPQQKRFGGRHLIKPSAVPALQRVHADLQAAERSLERARADAAEAMGLAA